MENNHNNKKRRQGKKKVPARSSQHIFTKSYSDNAVDNLKRLIQNQRQRGGERFYAIKVDGEFCIYKTSDVRMFDDYKVFVDATTESVEVVLYFGRSNNCNRHIFYLKDKPLSGTPAPVDVDKKIEEAMAQKDQEYLIKNLKKKVKRQAAIIEEQEEELEELRKKTDFKSIVTNGIALLGAFNANKSAATTALSGTPKAETSGDTNAEITINDVSSEENSEEKEDDKEKKEMFEEVYDHLGSKGMNTMINLMEAVSQSEEMRAGLNKLIEAENKRRQQQRNEVPPDEEE